MSDNPKFMINPEGYKPMPVNQNPEAVTRRRALDAFEDMQLRRELAELGVEIEDIDG